MQHRPNAAPARCPGSPRFDAFRLPGTTMRGMEPERFKPAVTVAAIIARDGHYLLVEEMTRDGLRLNNPAGGLEQGESLLEAALREALEETACPFTPEALLGVYLARFRRPAQGASPAEDVTYLRFAYRGHAGAPLPGRALDHGIVRTLWLTREEVARTAARHRSPLVMRCIDDHLAGCRYPLELVYADASVREPWLMANSSLPPHGKAT